MTLGTQAPNLASCILDFILGFISWTRVKVSNNKLINTEYTNPRRSTEINVAIMPVPLLFFFLSFSLLRLFLSLSISYRGMAFRLF